MKRPIEPERSIRISLPVSWFEAIQRVAKQRNVSRQVYLRMTIWRSLRRAGERVNRSESQRALLRIAWRAERDKKRGGPSNKSRAIRTKQLHDRWVKLAVQFTPEGEVWIDDNYFASGWLSRDHSWHHESPVPFEVLLWHLREQYLANVSLATCWLEVLRKYDDWHDFSGRPSLGLT